MNAPARFPCRIGLLLPIAVGPAITGGAPTTVGQETGSVIQPAAPDADDPRIDDTGIFVPVPASHPARRYPCNRKLSDRAGHR